MTADEDAIKNEIRRTVAEELRDKLVTEIGRQGGSGWLKRGVTVDGDTVTARVPKKGEPGTVFETVQRRMGVEKPGEGGTVMTQVVKRLAGKGPSPDAIVERAVETVG